MLLSTLLKTILMGDSTPAGVENIFGISDCSGNSHIETSLGRRMFEMLLEFVGKAINRP